MKKIVSIVILSTLLFFTAVSCGQNEKKSPGIAPVVENISASELHAMEEDIVLIDVRTPREFQSGHVKNAINIDYSSADFKTRIAELPKNERIFLYCKSGVRSSRAARQFEKLGFEKVYDLEGGLISWQRGSYPLVK